MSPDLLREIEELEFRELRELIDDCIAGNVDSKQKHLTFEPVRILQFIDILAKKTGEPENLAELPSAPQKSSIQLAAEKILRQAPSRFFNKKKGKRTQRLPDPELEDAKAQPVIFHHRLVGREGISIQVFTKYKKPLASQIVDLRAKAMTEHENYLAQLRNFERKQEAVQPRNLRQSIVDRLRRDLAAIEHGVPRTIKLSWKMLPSGEMPFPQIKRYLDGLEGFSRDEFDHERVKRILTLKPNVIYSGLDEFDGYLVFYFDSRKMAVLDSPRVGNAIYLFGEDWKQLSKLTKSELLNYHRSKTARIIHRGDWFNRLKFLLRRV